VAPMLVALLDDLVPPAAPTLPSPTPALASATP
jgi:hypothetical protein